MGITRELIFKGIAADVRGNRRLAAELFRRATTIDRHDEVAWLWRSSMAATDDERRSHLRRALSVNPRSEPARRGLAVLERTSTSASDR
jgi:hypothetical protein